MTTGEFYSQFPGLAPPDYDFAAAQENATETEAGAKEGGEEEVVEGTKGTGSSDNAKEEKKQGGTVESEMEEEEEEAMLD